ncbi:YIP1 family protein [Mechercharimyces sp. CAU 1602]|uniref:YIP1 family protein n=1 Tax=Mechercharimyces sp. CAU 1602 TaxID=2973933 RepID=UPI0021631E8B|nr:YIP1 family protein [Mechercharimyces sp. CAU 1602]MCS1351167.1 YIP1 family protein [Mechercharimyces sp. CAU 1602]
MRNFLLSPRSFFEELNNESIPLWKLFLLTYLLGLVVAFNGAFKNYIGLNLDLLQVLATVLFNGLLNGLVLIVVFVPLFKWIGNMLKGEGTWKRIYQMILFASLPLIMTLILWVIEIAIYGNFFTKGFIYYHAYGSMRVDQPIRFYIHLIVSVLHILAFFHTLILLFIGLSKAHSIKFWKSVIVLILSSVVGFFIIALLASIVHASIVVFGGV